MEKSSAKTEVKVDRVNPFCHYKRQDVKKDDTFKTFRFDHLEYDKETGKTKPVYAEYDLQAEIEARKEDAGFNAMRTLIMQGKAKAEDFQDDGKHGVDNTLLPKDPHQAKKLADAQSAKLGKLAEKLGVKPGEAITAEHLELLLENMVAKKFNEAKAVQEVKQDEQGK